jgi:hypothetical protein
LAIFSWQDFSTLLEWVERVGPMVGYKIEQNTVYDDNDNGNWLL